MTDAAAVAEAEALRLSGGDPFDDVRRASDEHREGHDGCRLYPAGPGLMSLAAQVVRLAGSRRLLDLGSGLGYSTFWLAAGAGPEATVLGIDADGGHVRLAERLARRLDLSGRVTFVTGEVAAVLEDIDGPIDFIHDDAWFASKPSHFDRTVGLLRQGGVLAMPNWFLLQDALADQPERDWTEFAGPKWRESVREFAAAISRDERLRPVWVTRPPLLIAVRILRPATAAGQGRSSPQL